ncbi:Histone deacetylase 8 [Coemansia sp. RSA 552]|nr:Histone deacetylase 8 [Coemansia sp. RSA 552]
MAPSQLGTRTSAAATEFDTIESALDALRNGEGIVVMDNENRENEGDLIFAAEKATPELLAFTIRHSSGYICVGMDPDRLDELQLPLMVKENTDPLRTQYTVSVDAASGVTTGISAADRSTTIGLLGDFGIKDPAALRRPGHVLPLRARKGGVLERCGHTEAATDLTRLAGLNPAGALCELVNDDGTMKRREDCSAFAKAHHLKMITISDLQLWYICAQQMDPARQVALIRSASSVRAADCLPPNAGRASRVHALINAFCLGKHVEIIEPNPLTDAGLAAFHSAEYIDALFGRGPETCSEASLSDSDDGSQAGSSSARFGLAYDCAVFDGLEDHVRYAAGGTVAAAQALARGRAHTAIHWEGGRHHSRPSRAAGFCYVNDIVLGILELQAQFARVLYIDLDLHHGDAVQDAFQHSKSVTTLSVHHFDRGFYPNSGGQVDEGRGQGAGHSLNIPLQRGAGDDTFLRVLSAAASSVVDAHSPAAVVVQCGCDGLAGDPHKVFNLTADGLVRAVELVLGWGLPTLLLGGGGYNSANCARCWTRITAAACGHGIAPQADVPDHVFLGEYAPGFDMRVDPTPAQDDNDPRSIDSIICEIKQASRR